MKKEFNQMVKAIKVTKKYTSKEVKKLSELFLYLNNIEGLTNEYKYWISAKGLRKLLEPLSRSGKKQAFREWRESVSNMARLKENEDIMKIEKINTIKAVKTDRLTWRGISQHVKSQFKSDKYRWVIPIREVDYVLTLRAGEYCATLTKWDAGDLYRRFIFDIKEEFIRLVFRWGKSIDTRVKFTTSISGLSFMQSLNKKEQSKLYAYFTNLVYKELQDVEMTSKQYKQKHWISKREVAKHYFKQDGLLDLEEIENKLATIIDYINPDNKDELEKVFLKFFDSLVK